jgi:hypothetical protein
MGRTVEAALDFAGDARRDDCDDATFSENIRQRASTDSGQPAASKPQFLRK